MILFFLLFVVVISVTTYVHVLVNKIVTEPYMDEIFHIPQAQAYCEGNLTQWDPKITTLPGLYLLSAGTLAPLNIFGIKCTASALRFGNVVFNWMNIIVLYKISKIKLKDHSEVTRSLFTLAVGLTPLLFFFSFLYYTDPASTLGVLLMYYLYLQKRYLLSPLLGAINILMRQTNIVWLCWTACNVVWDSGEPIFIRLMQPIIKQKRSQKSQKKGKRKHLEDELVYSSAPVLNLRELQRAGRTLALNVIPKAYMYVLVFGLFVTFVILNGGLVVGDKAAHTATINIPQLFYFSVFAMTIGFPTVTYKAQEVLDAVRRNRTVFLVAVVVGLVVVHFNTVAHPYLLADNRHYTFYMWKRLYESRPFMKYFLVPVYILFGFFVCTSLDLHPALVFTFIMTVAVNCVPQKLLEFRYFLLPYIFLRLHMKPPPNFVLVVELLWAIIVNVFTIYKFLYSPFQWAHSAEVQRFMW